MKRKNFNKLPNSPKMIKFNIYWIYAIIFLFFLGLQFFGTDLTKKTNFRDFNNNMLQQQKVDKITIVNKEKVFVFIKKEFLSEEQFKEVYKQPFGNSVNLGPHYFFEIGSVETFNSDLKEAQKTFDYEDQISPTYETKKDVFGDILGWILPLVFFIGIWIFIMRRMSGGGAGGGQIFSILLLQILDLIVSLLTKFDNRPQ